MSDQIEKRKRGQRGPGKKTLAIQNLKESLPRQPQPQPQLSESDSSFAEENKVDLDIEAQSPRLPKEESGFGATLRRAAETAGLFEDSDDKPATKAKNKKANQEEFNTLVVAVLTLAVSFANMPQDIKPNDSELGVFSNHLTGILIRHLPIAKGFSADALDIIGIFAVISGYYARIQPNLKARQPQVQAQADYQESVDYDPISALSPEAGSFLKVASLKQAV